MQTMCEINVYVIEIELKQIAIVSGLMLIETLIKIVGVIVI